MELPVKLNCVECETFLGVLTEKGLMVGNVLIDMGSMMQDGDGRIFCGECGKDIWESLKLIEELDKK
jgi:hypothetical protein